MSTLDPIALLDSLRRRYTCAPMQHACECGQQHFNDGLRAAGERLRALLAGDGLPLSENDRRKLEFIRASYTIGAETEEEADAFAVLLGFVDRLDSALRLSHECPTCGGNKLVERDGVMVRCPTWPDGCGGTGRVSR